MRYQDYKEKVLNHLEEYKLNSLGCVKNGLYQNKEYGHILPSGFRPLNFLLGVNQPKDIHYHMHSHHLNSSQIMCINFFEPIMKDNLLIDILKDTLKINIPDHTKIIFSKFEYGAPKGKDGTTFDFFIELITGEKIYFEVKYTEQGFGKISKSKETNKLPEKYEHKFTDVYMKQLGESMHLKELVNDKDKFYSSYQLYRNISYIKGDKDYVVFLYPYDNDNLAQEMNEVKDLKNVYSLDWKELSTKALDHTKNTHKYRVYKEFYDKYMDI